MRLDIGALMNLLATPNRLQSQTEIQTTKEPIIHIRHATTSDMDAIVNQIGE